MASISQGSLTAFLAQAAISKFGAETETLRLDLLPILQQRMARFQHRFSALDGMRGVCAVTVLIFHTFCYTSFNPLPFGYLSVDVFFVLSGFVIAFAFDDKLAAGLGVIGFMRARARRLGPVLLFGSVFGAVGLGIVDRGTDSLNALTCATIRNFLLIPSFGLGDQLAFPVNAPTWSLFGEFWVNVLFGILAPRLTMRVLASVMTIGWSGVILFAIWHGTLNHGGTSEYIFVALLRAIPGFACGVLIFKIWRSGLLARVPNIPPMAIFVAWIILVALPVRLPDGSYDLLLVIAIIPLLIVFLVRSESSLPGWILWLGRVSYPLYATHFVFVYAADRFLNWHPDLTSEMAVPVLSLALATLITDWYEPAAVRVFSFRWFSQPTQQWGTAHHETTKT